MKHIIYILILSSVYGAHAQESEPAETAPPEISSHSFFEPKTEADVNALAVLDIDLGAPDDAN